MTAAEKLIADLEVIADWGDELEGKVRRAAFIFELVDVDAVDVDALTNEIATFKAVCRALAARIPGSLVGTAAVDAERRAA
jgi:hypothetical protein